LAKAGGSRAIVSNRARSRSQARSCSKASASRHCLGAHVERHHAAGPCREVQREGAVIGEAVERAAAGPGERARHDAVGALVEEGTRLLAGPRRGPVAHRALAHLDALRHRAERQLHALPQALAAPHGDVVAEQDALGPQHLRQRREDVAAQRLDPGREELHDEPAVVAVADQ
jgi:hypothetical protein